MAEGNVEKPRKRSKRSTASVRGSSAVGRRALPGCSTFNLNDNFSKSNFYLDPYFSPDTRLLFQHSALVRLRCLTHRRRWIFVPRNSPMRALPRLTLRLLLSRHRLLNRPPRSHTAATATPLIPSSGQLSDSSSGCWRRAPCSTNRSYVLLPWRCCSFSGY